MAIMTKKFCLLLVSSFTVLWLGLFSPAAAHELRPAIAEVTVGQEQAQIVIELAVEPLLAGMDLDGLADTNNAPEAVQHDALRALEAAALEEAVRSGWSRIQSGLILQAGDARLTPELVAVQAAPVGDVALPRDTKLTVSAVLPAGSAPLAVGLDKGFGSLVVRQAAAGTEEPYAALLTSGQMSAAMPRGGGKIEQSWLSVVGYYIVQGFEHIIPKGLDHILFVLGLFFFSLKMRPLLMQVTAFTLAHTITLALATLGVVSVSPSIVEPLIAASIVYVAVENVFHRRMTPWRTAVIFGFGLLHGLGFASVLGDLGLSSGWFITSLISFNIGVELGQLSVIAVAFLLLGLPFGKKPWYRTYIANPASIAIAVIGAWWVIERTLL